MFKPMPSDVLPPGGVWEGDSWKRADDAARRAPAPVAIAGDAIGTIRYRRQAAVNLRYIFGLITRETWRAETDALSAVDADGHPFIPSAPAAA